MGSSLHEEIAFRRRKYKKALCDLYAIAASELDDIDSPIHCPSVSLEMAAFHIIQESNRLKSLLDLDLDQY